MNNREPENELLKTGQRDSLENELASFLTFLTRYKAQRLLFHLYQN
jgi:hypothetical protein